MVILLSDRRSPPSSPKLRSISAVTLSRMFVASTSTVNSQFDDFFHSLAGKQKFTVRIDGEDALNVFIARSLLQALCEHKEEIYLKPLHEHAAIWFYEYLKYFVEKLDSFEPDRENLSITGAKLSYVLYNTKGIEL
jgi:hypothetical protein